MSDEQYQQTVEVWRKLISTRLPADSVAGPQRSVAELRTALLHLEERARPWILPPQRGFSGETTAVLRQWQPAWTQDLKNSPLWQSAKEQIAAIRESIRNGRLNDADWQIRDIFIRCVPAARKLALAGFPARAVSLKQNESSNRTSPTEDAPASSESAADELSKLLDWLGSL